MWLSMAVLCGWDETHAAWPPGVGGSRNVNHAPLVKLLTMRTLALVK